MVQNNSSFAQPWAEQADDYTSANGSYADPFNTSSSEVTDFCTESYADPYADPFNTSFDEVTAAGSDSEPTSAGACPPMDSEQLIKQMHDEEDRLFIEKARSVVEPCLIKANDKIPPLMPVLRRHEQLVCSEGNLSAVVGEAKSKKTFLCTALVGSMLDITQKHLFGIEHNRCRVLWVDTEQSPAHIQKVMFRINLLGGLTPTVPDHKLRMLQLREKSPADRYQALEYGIALYQPKLVVVDGISDLLCDTNCLKESEELVSRLLTLASLGHCHIMCVLHTNPNSDKARGHLGSTLMRKAETVLYVHKTGECSVVEPQYCRNEEFARFAFKVEEMPDAEFIDPLAVGLGIPVECDLPSESEQREDDCVRILRDELGGVAERMLLCNKLVSVLGITPSYSRVKVFRALEKGLLTEQNGVVRIHSV